MAAYPPGPSRLAVLPNYGANSAPADLLYIVSAAVGLNAGDASDRFITPNDFLETVTRNITQKTLIFEDADGVRTVSAVNTGKIDYSVTDQSFQVSENGGAYQNLVKGVGANTRVAYWTATDTLSSDSAFLWDETNDRLLISVSVASGVAPIDVMADALSVAQQWRENGAGTGRVQMQMGSGFGQLGTTVADDFALMTNSLQRVNVEATGSTVFGSIVPATGQVMINSLTALTTGLVVNNAAASSVDIALFQVNSSNRAILTENSEWILGLAATVSGKLTMANSAGATLTSWSAGNAASTLNFIWPVVDPSANQVLSAAAPVAGDVTLSWATVVTGPALPIGSVQFNGGGVFDGDADLLWDDTAKQLLVGGIALASGVAPIDVMADALSVAQQWRENGAGTGRVQMQMGSGFGQLGTTVSDDFALMTNSLQRVNVEATGSTVFGSIVPATGQVMINSLTALTTGLVVNNAAASSVDIALFQVNSSNRAILTENSEWILGLAATVSGKLTMANSAGATLTSWSAGNAASTLNFIWPVVDPSANQVLSAAAPVAGDVTLSWATVVTGPALPIGSVQFNGGGVFDGDADLLWDDTAKQLLIGGLALASGVAPIDVMADALSVAQQWRENGAGTGRVQMQMGSGFGQLGTTVADDFALMTNSLQRVNVEATGSTVFGSIVPATGQVMINSLTALTTGLVVNNAAASSVDIALFQVNSSNRFIFTNAGEMIAGLAATIDGKLTMASAGAAFTQSLMAGTSPVATNAFRWPNADPTAGQALTASAPAAGVVTLSWTTISGSATINPTDGVMPVRTSATTFGDSKISLATNSTIVTAADAAAFVVGPNGATNPTLSVVTNVASAATGLSITGNAAGSGVTLTALSSGTNEGITISAKGTSPVTIQATGNTGSGGAFIIKDGVAGNTVLSFRGSSSIGDILYFNGASATMRHTANVGVTIGAGLVFGIASTSAVGTVDIALDRSAANTFRVTNGGVGATGAGNLLIAPSTASVTGNFTVLPDNAATNTIVTVARLGVNSTGTAADGFGAALSFSAESSTTNDSETARINAFWTTATHANRTAAISWSITNNTSLAEYMRLSVAALASPVVLAVHGGTNPNVWTSGSFAAKLYLIDATLPAVGVAAHFSATALDAPQWQMLRGRGTNASPTAIQNGDSIGNIEWWGQTSTSTNNVVAGARIRVSTTENWSAGNNGCQMIFYTSNNAGTITDRVYIKETGTVRIGGNSGSYNTTNLLQVGNYASFATGILASFYTGADATKGIQIIGTNAQSGNMLEVFRDSLTPNLLTLAASGLLSLRAGLNTGVIVANVGGTLAINTTSEANVSTSETDLMTYTVVANTEGTNGDRIVFTCAGSFTASVNNKQLRAYLGSTLLFDTGALAFAPSTDVAWKLTVTIYRTGSAAQGSVAEFAAGGAVLISDVQLGGGTEDFTTNLVFKLTGQAGASDEIFQDLMISEWHPAGS